MPFIMREMLLEHVKETLKTQISFISPPKPKSSAIGNQGSNRCIEVNFCYFVYCFFPCTIIKTGSLKYYTIHQYNISISIYQYNISIILYYGISWIFYMFCISIEVGWWTNDEHFKPNILSQWIPYWQVLF